MEEFIQELFNKDEEIGRLQTTIFKLENANKVMKATINNLINMKCKRGESAYALNAELDTSLQNNLMDVHLMQFSESGDLTNSVSDYLLTLLIGKDKNQVPCCILENNNILYEENGTYVVCTCDEFNSKMYECVSNYLCSKFRNELVDDNAINMVNTLLNKATFLKVMKRTLLKYKSS